MALVTPTTQQIADTIVAQIEASLSQTVPLLPKAFTRVLAKALAGTLVLVYRYAGSAHLQMFVRHASIRETTINGVKVRPLVEWGRLIGVGDPIDATRAELVVDVTVDVQTGTLAAGSQVVRAETGVVYQTTAPVALDAAVVAVTIRATSDPDGGGGAGVVGNLEIGDALTFANPLPNVSADVVVTSVAEVGADAETEDAYRGRVERRFQRKPQGGAYADYQVWAEGVAGVAAAYPYTGDPGQVDVYVEATDTVDPDGIPDAALLTSVSEAIELDDDGLANRRPANALVNVVAISRLEFSVTVGNLDAEDPAAAQASIDAAVDEYFRARQPFVTGLSTLPRNDRVTQGAVGGVVNEVASAAGATVGYVELELAGDLITSYTLGDGELAKLAGAACTYV